MRIMIKTPKTLGEFKKELGEKIQKKEKTLGSEEMKKKYKSELFREIVIDTKYKKMKRDFLAEKKSEKRQKEVYSEVFACIKKMDPNMTEEEFKKLYMGESEKAKNPNIFLQIIGKFIKNIKEKFEYRRKALEKERKTAAIAELDRIGKKTDENVERINAVQFLNDKILIGNTPWAYKNMRGGKGIFIKEKNRWYYDFEERKAEAKKQGITLPEKKDFENTLKALLGEYSENYQGGNILSIILGESNTGYCDKNGDLNDDGRSGSLGSVSEYYIDTVRTFGFNKYGSILYGNYKHNRFICRPLVKNS